MLIFKFLKGKFHPDGILLSTVKCMVFKQEVLQKKREVLHRPHTFGSGFLDNNSDNLVAEV